jgi:hypothetical protein
MTGQPTLYRRQRMKAFLGTVFLLAFCCSTRAETVVSTALACKTEDSWKEGMKYLAEGKSDGVMQLAAAGECVLIRPGEPISIIDRGRSWGQIAFIRYRSQKLVLHRLLLQP